jgi:moderate conductance mechanosensitive channel
MPFWGGPLWLRILLIALAAILAHIAVRLIRTASRSALGSKLGSIAKAKTVLAFLSSVAVFVIWFLAVGIALRELGVNLQTYLASATIIGLAVSFGSQSLVQDVISGLTLIFTGLVEVGDMVDLGGQVGVVEKIGIRYTELRNVQGAVVFIPNRNVGNVTTFPVGYIRAFVDVRLPREPEARAPALHAIERIAEASYSQLGSIMIKAPSVNTMSDPAQDQSQPASDFVRLKFRIWPGQGTVIEQIVRPRLIHTLRGIDETYQDWMVSVHYRVEPTFSRRAFSALELLQLRRESRRR